MKKLFLIRHAKSSWEDSDQTDFERPLNKRGEHDAKKIALLLNQDKIFPDLMLSSPAKRALTTANIFAEKLNYPIEKIVTNEKIYEAGIRELTSVVEEMGNSFNNVMLFGHNPGLTGFVNMLGNKQVPHLPTCAVVGLNFNIESWNKLERYTGEIFLFEFPKKYKLY